MWANGLASGKDFQTPISKLLVAHLPQDSPLAVPCISSQPTLPHYVTAWVLVLLTLGLFPVPLCPSPTASLNYILFFCWF